MPPNNLISAVHQLDVSNLIVSPPSVQKHALSLATVHRQTINVYLITDTFNIALNRGLQVSYIRTGVVKGGIVRVQYTHGRFGYAE